MAARLHCIAARANMSTFTENRNNATKVDDT